MLEILSPGQKIRKIRKEIAASQQDLESINVSRSMISKLEREHVKLLPETAKSIANRVNEIIVQKGISIPLINWEHIMESEKDQISKAMNEYMARLKEIKMSELSIEACELFFKEIESFMNSNDVCNETKYFIYMDMGEFYEVRLEWGKRMKYALRGYDLAIQMDDIYRHLESLKLITTAAYHLKKYDDVILYGEHAEASSRINKNDITDTIQKIKFNMALAYKKLNKYDLCLQYLKELVNGFLEFDSKLVLANCYYNLKEFEKAEQFYWELAAIARRDENHFSLATAYRAIAWCKIEKKDYKAARELLNKASAIKVLDCFYMDAYNTLEIEIEMGNIEYVEKNYLSILEEAIKNKDEQIEICLLNKVFNFYIEKEQVRYIIRLLRVIKNKIYDEKIMNRQLIEIYFKSFAYFYKKYPKECDEIVNQGMRIIDFFDGKGNKN